jgi:hypothetical protein
VKSGSRSIVFRTDFTMLEVEVEMRPDAGTRALGQGWHTTSACGSSHVCAYISVYTNKICYILLYPWFPNVLFAISIPRLLLTVPINCTDITCKTERFIVRLCTCVQEVPVRDTSGLLPVRIRHPKFLLSAMLARLTVWKIKNTKSPVWLSWFSGTPYTGRQQNTSDKTHR